MLKEDDTMATIKMNLDDAKEIFDEIERSYDVKEIKFNGEPLWPYIRFDVYSRLLNDYSQNNNSNSKKDKRITSYIKATKRSALSLLAQKCDNVLFTDTREVRLVDGRYIDKISDRLINLYGSFLVVVQTITKKNAFVKYVDYEFLQLLVAVFRRINHHGHVSIQGEDILEEIVKDYDLPKYCLNNIIDYIITAKKVYRWLFERIQPKRIFVNCYYDLNKMPAISVAKDMGIVTIELQHGIIRPNHVAYNTSVYIEQNPYPEYLFCYGERHKEYISPFIYSNEKIVLVGSNYIDMILERKLVNEQLFKQKYGKYNDKIIVTFAASVENDNATYPLMRELAQTHSEICLIYVPRCRTDYHNDSDVWNFCIEEELDVYQCMQNSSCTITVFSTCSIESLRLGTPLVLYNYQHQAENMYETIGGNENNGVFITDDIEECFEKILQAISVETDLVVNLGKQFFADNHEMRLRNALTYLK